MSFFILFFIKFYLYLDWWFEACKNTLFFKKNHSVSVKRSTHNRQGGNVRIKYAQWSDYVNCFWWDANMCSLFFSKLSSFRFRDLREVTYSSGTDLQSKNMFDPRRWGTWGFVSPWTHAHGEDISFLKTRHSRWSRLLRERQTSVDEMTGRCEVSEL
jgi:hypothetical protein